MPALTLLGKPDCHLCHEMHAVVERVLAGRGIDLVWRDVTDDPEWKRRYLLDIPVLLWGDLEVARHRVSPEALVARLAALGLPEPST